MIGGIRKFAKSKWALVLLFIPLVISFGIFGFQDPFRGISGGGLSKVGDREIHARDVTQELQAEIDRIREQEGRVLSQADAIREGLGQQVLFRLEYRNAVLAYAEKKGIRASTEGVSDLIVNRANAFKDALGRFNLDAVRTLASRQNMSLKQFEETARDDLTAGYVTSAAFTGLEPPQLLSLPVINYLGETRTISMARINDSTLTEPKAPTDAEMETWYNSHKEMFAQPERRRISVLTYSPEDFIDRVELTDDKVKAEYDARIRDYSTPETRVITEYTSPDRNNVQTFIDLTQQGIAPDEALKRVPGLTATDKTVKPADITHEDYSKLVFDLAANKVHPNLFQLEQTTPFQTVMVKSITPGIPQPFEQAAAQVRRDLALPEATRLFQDESEKFLDAAGGQPLEDIGKQFGFPVIQLPPVDRQARTARGDQSQLLANPQALGDLFTLQPGQMTQLFEGDNSRTMYRLDEIVAPYTQAFAEVKDRVRLEYMREQVETAATKAANDMVAAVKAGRTFEQAATAAKLTALPAISVTRQGGPNADPTVLQGSFNTLKAGEVGVVPGRNREPWVVRVDKIEPVTPAATAALRAQIGPEMAQSLEQDLREVFFRGMQNEVPMQRDAVAIDQFFKSYTQPDPQ